LARYCAARFRNRGEPYDDLVQVATVGLIKAVDGFDFSRGEDLVSYAVPTMIGEIKRHFRDRGWSMRVPRRLQELRIEISNTVTRLTQELRRVPTVADIAAELNLDEESVIEGLGVSDAYAPLSLHTPSAEGATTTLADSIGGIDTRFEAVEDREALRPALASLSPRDQRILVLRFFGYQTQTQIAEEIGVSQMHVSRLLARALATLRERMKATA
jgi:RNA polymerase sigma-B factor